MTGIATFMGKGKKTQDEMRKQKFEVLIKGKEQDEIRQIEEALLKPKPITKYTGPKTGLTDFLKRTVAVTFPKKSWVERLGKFMRIGQYVQNNTYDVEMLTELIQLMEAKRLRWNRREKKFYFKERVGRRFRL